MLSRVRLPVAWLLALTALIGATLACGPRRDDQDAQQAVRDVFLTVTAQASITPTVTPTVASATPTLPPTATSTLTPTPPDQRTGNGANINAPRCSVTVAVDAMGEDWQAQPAAPRQALDAVTYGAGEWLGADDLSAVAQLCWTDSALYLWVDVRDDIHVQTQRGETAWRGDEVEMLFDANLYDDFYITTWGDDDTQLGLSPGDFADLLPAAVRYYPIFSDAIPAQVAARQTEHGYVLEASIAWSALSVTAQTGGNYGFCLALSDNDHVGTAQQDSMVGHCTRLGVFDPTTWATLHLAP